MDSSQAEDSPSCRLPQALESQEFSDLQIKCGDKTFSVHKVIICSQSRFFRAACLNDCVESKNGVIDLPEDDPDVIGHLIRYLYTSVYPTKVASQYLLDINLYTIADKYDVPRLKIVAKRSFQDRLFRRFGKAKEAHEQPTGDHGKIRNELLNIIGCIPLIYEATPESDRGLRDIVVHHAKVHCAMLRQPPYMDKFEEVFVQVPAFALNLLDGLIQQASNSGQSDDFPAVAP